MNDAVHEFLALKRARQDRGAHQEEDQLDPIDLGEVTARPRPERTKPELQQASTEVCEIELVAYFAIALAAHPADRLVKDRQGMAEYLARSVIHKYGDPRHVSWRSGNPVSHRDRSHIPWRAVCPAGHPTDEALETNQVVGWVCEQCEKVYDARECRVVNRDDVCRLNPMHPLRK
jgi:hypothetical protein